MMDSNKSSGFSLSRRAASRGKRRRKLPIPSFSDMDVFNTDILTEICDDDSLNHCPSLLPKESEGKEPLDIPVNTGMKEMSEDVGKKSLSDEAKITKTPIEEGIIDEHFTVPAGTSKSTAENALRNAEVEKGQSEECHEQKKLPISTETFQSLPPPNDVALKAQKTENTSQRKRTRKRTAKAVTATLGGGGDVVTHIPSCALCKSCICRVVTTKSDQEVDIDWAKSDRDIERSLMRRLVKLEQQTEQCTDREGDCRRRLKKQRKEMYKKRENILKHDQTLLDLKSRFLPDVEQAEELEQITGLRQQSPQVVTNATASVFGKSSVATKRQPTLTQMFGDPTSDELSSRPPSSTLEPIVECDDDPVENQVQPPGSAQIESAPPRSIVDFHRVESFNDDPGGVISSWEAVSSGRFRSVFDNLFDHQDEKETEAKALDDLVGMIDVVSDQSEIDGPGKDDVHPGMLSQRAKSVANTIIERVKNDPAAIAKLEQACPNWEENVLFAMIQKEKESVEDALEHVREARAKLGVTKQSFLKAIAEQEAALDVFEESLQESLGRWDSSQSAEP